SLTPCGVVNNEIVYSHVGAQLNTTGPAISNESGKRKLMESANSIMDHQKRSKSGDERNITNIHGIETYNQFSELDEDNSNITSHMDLNNTSSALPPLLFTTNNTKRKTSNVNKDNTTNPSSQSNSNTNPTNPIINNTKKGKTLPPIVVFNTENKSLIEALNIIISDKQFRIKISNANRTHIFTNNLDDFNKVREFLKHKKANNYSYTPKESKPVNYVVKGIDRSFDNEVVRDAIAAQCPKVVILKRPGHAASNCNMKYRCMKCLNDHDPSKCPRTEQLELVKARGDANELEQFSKEVSCVNCGEIGHPANYKKCKDGKPVCNVPCNIFNLPATSIRWHQPAQLRPEMKGVGDAFSTAASKQQ
ncbi:hypothetical protein Bhyg_02861, partial [Pseudolycoriella hygida]